MGWQRAVDLSVEIYRFTSDFPREEIYGITAQMRRSAVSIASNIAEGYGRNSRNEYRHFLGVARGSILELQTRLAIARKLGFGKPELLEKTENLSEETGKIIWAIIKKLDCGSPRPQPSTEPRAPSPEPRAPSPEP
ncbi:MAG: four helix bundle protein, partial [Silvibacterium sp.]